MHASATITLLALALLPFAAATPIARSDVDAAASRPILAATSADSPATIAAELATTSGAPPSPTPAAAIDDVDDDSAALVPLGPVHVELPLPVDSEFAQLPPARRVVSYDQRQAGKYNVRADLENFMIVVIPSSPAGGAVSLLDLLTRTNQQQQKHQKLLQKSSTGIAHKKEGHKKYHAPLATKGGVLGSSDAAEPKANKATVVLQPDEAVGVDHRPQAFIEGRTPYHVDISSAGALQQQQEKQLYAQLLPMALADDDLMRRFAAQQQLLQQQQQQNIVEAARASKALHVAGVGGLQPVELGHNSVVLIGRMRGERPATPVSRHLQRGFAWTDVFDKSAERYDALLRGDEADEDESADSVDRLAAGEAPKSGDGGGWDQLTLLGADEQCGPDRRRDSYGVCQFVPID